MDCEELKSLVTRWLGQEIECHSTGGDCLTATFPLLKPNGDPIEIGIESIEGHRWKLSDLGDTYSTLYLAGVDLYEEYVRAEEFRQIIAAHRINDSEQELFVESSSGELVDSIFDFVHAIQSMLALQLTVRPKQSPRDFPSIVAKFLAEQHASFELPAEHIEGKTGSWKFNFVLNQVREETLVKALTAISKSQALKLAEESVFEIQDVKAIRDTKAIVIADDEKHRRTYWQPQVMRVFEGYDVPIYPFKASRQDLTELVHRYSH